MQIKFWFPKTCVVYLASCLFVAAQGHADFWDLAPIRYSDTAATDRLSVLAEKFAAGKEVPTELHGMKKLEYVLDYLDVPKESQVLVFSKTSLQNSRISPTNPRCLYYSENAYVGYVPGGSIEVIIQDPVLGPVFYLIEEAEDGSMKIERDSNRCMSCHANSRTEEVPGLLIRSVYSSDDGHPNFRLGTFDVSHETPLKDRWGGWFVTGKSAQAHLGNRFFNEDSDLSPAHHSISSVEDAFEISGYLRPTSDIVSLLVLEHQVKMHTLLNAASMNYRRIHYFVKTLNPEGDSEGGSTGRMADDWAKKIVEYMFFKGEADLGDGVEGDPTFQQKFTERFPRSSKGGSLAEFRLYGRIFKNRCSYMVYSDAFNGLPKDLKKKVLAKMKRVVSGKEKDFDWIKKSELKRIDAILGETLAGWK